MAIISQESFDKFTEEEKQQVRDYYKPDETEKSDYSEGYYNAMVALFGKENLQPKPKIKTWEDVEANSSNNEIEAFEELFGNICCGPGMGHGCAPICRKLIATYKIAKLIELGYGGIVSKEEWENSDIPKYCIVPDHKIPGTFIMSASYKSNDMNLIAFHTPEQMAKFMYYESNRTLMKQYYMI